MDFFERLGLSKHLNHYCFDKNRVENKLVHDYTLGGCLFERNYKNSRLMNSKGLSKIDQKMRQIDIQI